MLVIITFVYIALKFVFSAHKSRYKWKNRAVLVRAVGDRASMADGSEKTWCSTGCDSAVCNEDHHCLEPEEMFSVGSQASGKESEKSQEFFSINSDAFDSRKTKRVTYHSWFWFRGGKEHLPQTTGKT